MNNVIGKKILCRASDSLGNVTEDWVPIEELLEAFTDPDNSSHTKKLTEDVSRASVNALTAYEKVSAPKNVSSTDVLPSVRASFTNDSIVLSAAGFGPDYNDIGLLTVIDSEATEGSISAVRVNGIHTATIPTGYTYGDLVRLINDAASPVKSLFSAELVSGQGTTEVPDEQEFVLDGGAYEYPLAILDQLIITSDLRVFKRVDDPGGEWTPVAVPPHIPIVDAANDAAGKTLFEDVAGTIGARFVVVNGLDAIASDLDVNVASHGLVLISNKSGHKINLNGASDVVYVSAGHIALVQVADGEPTLIFTMDIGSGK